MAEQTPNWLQVIANDPILRVFLGVGVLISVIAFTNDIRKRVFILPPRQQQNDVVHAELISLYKEIIEAKNEYIDDLQEQLDRTKTQPIPDMSDEE